MLTSVGISTTYTSLITRHRGLLDTQQGNERLGWSSARATERKLAAGQPFQTPIIGNVGPDGAYISFALEHWHKLISANERA